MTVAHLLLAEELALLALVPTKEDSGRRTLRATNKLNTCIAGLLVGELMLEGHVRKGARANTVVLVDGNPPTSLTLVGAALFVADYGPKIAEILLEMERNRVRGVGLPWDAAVLGLVEAGVIAPQPDRLRSHYELIDPARRDILVSQLHVAASADDPLEPRTALLLAMAGSADQLHVIGAELPADHTARRARHALDGTLLRPLLEAVRWRLVMRPVSDNVDKVPKAIMAIGKRLLP